MKYKTFIKWLLYINLGFIALMVGITIFVKIPAAVAILGVLAIGALVYRWLFKKKEEEYSKSISEKTSGMLNDEDFLNQLAAASRGDVVASARLEERVREACLKMEKVEEEFLKTPAKTNEINKDVDKKEKEDLNNNPLL